DLEYRRRQGETPQPEEYRHAFSGFGEHIETVFGQQQHRRNVSSPAQTLPLLTDDEMGRFMPVEEEPGFGSLATDKGCLPLQAMEVNAQIEGLLAHVTVRQSFVNTLEEPIEATYIFPLPDRMAATHFRMEVEGREIEAVLKERAAARQEYSAAVKEGHRAA